MGKIEYENYTINYIHLREGRCIHAEEIKSIDNIPKDIYPSRMKKLSHITKTEYKIISESDKIEERLHINDKVKIENEDLTIEKVIQCENGNVICYTNKLIDKIIDKESLELADNIYNQVCKNFLLYHKSRRAIEHEKLLRAEEEEKNSKKWWQFWK